MKVDLYSRRKALANKPKDVFTYTLPKDLRVAIVYLMREAIGSFHFNGGEGFYEAIEKILQKEHRRGQLYYESNAQRRLENYFVQLNDDDLALDVIEITFRCIERILGRSVMPLEAYGITTRPREAVDELNERLREDGSTWTDES